MKVQFLLLMRRKEWKLKTIANAYLAIDNDLTILPIINKMDLPSADLDRTKEELIDALGMDPSEAVPVSAKQA